MERLRKSASMGLMLESSSDRLMGVGMAHDNAPDKKPALRLKTIEEAGRLRIPFTTGILIGIGETLDERVDSVFAIREIHERFGHIQEVIIQNFRAKPDIPMRKHPEPGLMDHLPNDRRFKADPSRHERRGPAQFVGRAVSSLVEGRDQ
jgi:FO synthase